MIVILCNSFQDAQIAFSNFMTFLETYEPLSITNVYECSYCVEVDDIRYMFVDRRFKKLTKSFDLIVDHIDMDEFFEDLGEYYIEVYDSIMKGDQNAYNNPIHNTIYNY